MFKKKKLDQKQNQKAKSFIDRYNTVSFEVDLFLKSLENVKNEK